MSDSIQVVDYFYTQAPDKPGEGCRALEALKNAGVNLLAFSGFPAGGANRNSTLSRWIPRRSS